MGRMVLLAMFVLAVTPAAAETAPTTRGPVASSEFSAQPRARLRVYPGRLLYRECVFRLVPQWRPSGTVIVPRQRCWWVRG